MIYERKTEIYKMSLLNVPVYVFVHLIGAHAEHAAPLS